MIACIHPLDRRSSEKRDGKFTGIDVCAACGKRWRIEAVSDRKKGEGQNDPDEYHDVTDIRAGLPKKCQVVKNDTPSNKL
jgi:hypothetical protein